MNLLGICENVLSEICYNIRCLVQACFFMFTILVRKPTKMAALLLYLGVNMSILNLAL